MDRHMDRQPEGGEVKTKINTTEYSAWSGTTLFAIPAATSA